MMQLYVYRAKTIVLPFLILLTAWADLGLQVCLAQPAAAAMPYGQWFAQLKCPGGAIRFGLRIEQDKQGRPHAKIINGAEVIGVDEVSITAKKLRIGFPHYDSAIVATFDEDRKRLQGSWKKRVGDDRWSELSFSATKSRTAVTKTKDSGFAGRWQVKFSSSQDPAVGLLAMADSSARDHRSFRGTFLTTTGDYRYLAGDVLDGKLELSVFDGAHAFLFRVEQVGKDQLTGHFWSRDSWHETWTARRDANARLPDAFKQTRYTAKVRLQDLKFPDLTGTPRSLADKSFGGKVRIISIFGSWCPNCHDSALYLTELHKKYHRQGLAIVGLAFEVSTDFKRNVQVLNRYIERHQTPYPILVAGLSDKAKASKRLPILDRIRSYPTTIFLNEKNEVISIHTGFTGPATGQAYQQLRQRFEAIIERQLKL